MAQEQPGLTPLGKLVVYLFILGCIGGGIYMLVNPKDSKEKRRWLQWAVEQFKQTEEGKSIQINLIPLGSIEGANAIISGDEKIHVWSPASAAYEDKFIQDFQLKYYNNPITNPERPSFRNTGNSASTPSAEQ